MKPYAGCSALRDSSRFAKSNSSWSWPSPLAFLPGFCVVLFRVAIAAARLWLLGSSMHPGVPRVVLVPALMGLVIAVVAVRFFPRVRGSGVNQTKGALYIYDGYISSETVVGKFVLSALAIGSGQSLGPEDPALLIGAGVASSWAAG